MLIRSRAVVEIRFGPRAYLKTVVEPGRALRVGRADWAELVVPHDAQMSAVHFQLSWDGEHCLLRDLDSARGTRLNGERVDEGIVPNGGWIQAGDTHFMVHVEAHTPPDGEDAAATKALQAEKTDALAALRREEAPLFGVVDAARGRRVLALLRESVDDYRSLYDGIRGEALASVAPYLVALRPDSSLVERLVHEGWSRRWGIYFTSREAFRDVRRHLRRFLLVEDDQTAKRMYFRFYDPSVLRAFLPTCTPRQREDFFGAIGCFLAEGEGGEPIRLPRQP